MPVKSPAKSPREMMYPKNLTEVVDVVNKLQPMYEERSRATLVVYAGVVFGIKEDRIKSVNTGMTSYVEGVQISLFDGTALNILHPTSADSVNDAIAPSCITFEGDKYVSFVEVIGEGNANVFSGDIPNIVDGSLISGDSLSYIIENSKKFFGEYHA